MFEDDGERQYVVVRNHEDQYSIWPESQPVPAGWQALEKVGAKAECLAYIEEVWTDMRPKSLRQHMDERRGTGEQIARKPTA